MNYFKCFILVPALFILLIGCGKGPTGQELERIYQDYHKALQAEDIETLKKFLASDSLKELTGEGVELRIRMIKEFLPSDIEVTKTLVSGSKATLKVAGKMKDQKMTGEVEFVKEGGAWKIVKENWQVSLEIETPRGAPVYPGKPRAFIEDTKKLPRIYQILKGHQGEIYDICFTPDNRCLLSAGYGDFTLRVWNIDSGEEISKVRTKNRVRDLAITPDSSSVLTADAYRFITMWSLQDGILSNPRILAEKAGDKVAISPDGEYFATTGYRETLRLWDLSTGDLEKQLSGKTNFRSLRFSKSGEYLAAGSYGSAFTLWDTKKWRDKTYKISKVSQNSDVASIDISRDDRYLATGHMDSSIVIFDLQEGRELHNFYVPQAATWDVKFSADGAILATAQQNKIIYLWETRTGEKAAALEHHNGAVMRLAFSPDGTTLASAGEDRQIIIWRREDAGHSGQVVQPQVKKAAAKAAIPEMMDVDGVDNLVKNPYANQGLQFWEARGDTSIRQDEEGNPYFVIKYSGNIWQDVKLGEEDAGRWVLLISLSSSERINRDGDQTGLPYLYGYLLNRVNSNRIDSYLQGQNMMHSVREPNKWGVIYGIFQVPETSGGIRLFLQQADGRYAQNGSAACFDEPGIYLFDSEEEAKAFAKEY